MSQAVDEKVYSQGSVFVRPGAPVTLPDQRLMVSYKSFIRFRIDWFDKFILLLALRGGGGVRFPEKALHNTWMAPYYVKASIVDQLLCLH